MLAHYSYWELSISIHSFHRLELVVNCDGGSYGHVSLRHSPNLNSQTRTIVQLTSLVDWWGLLDLDLVSWTAAGASWSRTYLGMGGPDHRIATVSCDQSQERERD